MFTFSKVITYIKLLCKTKIIYKKVLYLWSLRLIKKRDENWDQRFFLSDTSLY